MTLRRRLEGELTSVPADRLAAHAVESFPA
jgi:hypothetical protein